MKHMYVRSSYDLSMEVEVSSVASLLAERARVAMLVALLDGRALPAGELARAAGVSAQSASNHLNMLRQENMLQVEQQGRHRYYRLHRPEVAQAIESLATLTPLPSGRPHGSKDSALCYARHCYSHLAGHLAVQILERMEQQDFLRPRDETSFTVTARGQDWFKDFGLDDVLWDSNRGKLACRCLDWTERRHHLSGRLGVAFFRRLVETGWLKSIRNSRAMRVTDEGRLQLECRLGIVIPSTI
jgi:DNA-binding transcriptional ArsR family regulator